MSLKRNSKDMTPTQAIDAIRNDGDAIDRSRILQGNYSKSFYASVGTLLFFEGLADVPSALVLGTIGSTIGVNTAIRKAKKIHYGRKASAIDRLQEAANTALPEEPMDIFRQSKRSKALTIRWYGLDDNDSDLPTLLDRSRNIIQFARTQEIDTVAVNSAPFHITDETLLRDGPDYISDVKNHHRFPYFEQGTFHDSSSAESLIEMGIDEFEALIDELEITKDNRLYDSIAAAISDQSVKDTFLLFRANPSDKGFRNSALNAIKNALERHGGEVKVWHERSDDGTPIKMRATVLPDIKPNSTVIDWEHTLQEMDADAIVRFGGSKSLARYLGFTDNEALIEHVQASDKASLSQEVLMAALHILLAKQDDRLHVDRIQPLDDPYEPDETPRSMLESRIFKYDSRKHDSEIERSRSLFSDLRKVSAVGLIAMLALSAGGKMADEANDAYDRESDRYEAFLKDNHYGIDETEFSYVGDENYDTFLRQAGIDSIRDRAIYESVYAAEGAVWAATARLADFLVEGLHLPGFIGSGVSSDFDYKLLQQWKEDHGLNTPETMLDQPDEGSFVGDAQIEKNIPLFEVDSLTGATSQGYWYTGVYNSLNVLVDPNAAASKPVLHYDVNFKDYKREKVIDKASKTTVDDIIDQNPDLMVETPYIGYGEFEDGVQSMRYGIKLPVREGTRVLGAAIVDKKNPTNSYVVPIAIDPEGQVYTDHVDGFNHMESTMMEEPVLRYWLKEDAATAPIPLNRSMNASIIYGDIARDVYSKDEVEKVANSVRKALGLPQDAPYVDIYRAIKQDYEYSFTPISDRGSSLMVQNYNKVQILQDIATKLARLEALNCNLATTLTTLATLDTAPTQAAGGFYNSDDKYLSTLESHSWLIDKETAKVIDNTPAGPELPPLESSEQKSDDNSPPLDRKTAAEILIGAAFIAYAYRKRTLIRKLSDKAHVTIALGSETQQAAVEDLKFDLFAGPSSQRPTTRQQQDVIGPVPLDQVLRDYVANVPQGSKGSTWRQKVIISADSAVRRVHASSQSKES